MSHLINSTTEWGPNVQMLEPMGDTLLLLLPLYMCTPSEPRSVRPSADVPEPGTWGGGQLTAVQQSVALDFPVRLAGALACWCHPCWHLDADLSFLPEGKRGWRTHTE